MKFCPKCNTQYADDTLSFCLEDGTPLAAARQTDVPTEAFADIELVTRVRSSGHSTGPRFMESELTRVGSMASLPTQAPPGSRTALAVVLTALGMAAFFGVVSVVGYIIYLNKDRPIISNMEPNRNGGTPNSFNTNTAPTRTPSASPSSTLRTDIPTPTANPTPPPVDESTVKSEVSKQVYAWKSALESRDLSSYMGNYADTLDYYTKQSVSVGTVRADKARAMAKFDAIQVEISNMSVSPGSDGQTATAVFDKAWTFSERDTSSGKVRSQLIFRRTSGRWLITSERDLKVYYTR